MDERRLDPSGDPGHEAVDPLIWSPPQLPEDVRRMGLTRNTEEGAWLELAGSLDPDRPAHLVVAWLLLGLFALPVLLGVAHLLGW